MPERRIAPGPPRRRQAWQAGLRPGSRWLGVGVSCLAIGVAIDVVGPLLVRGWGAMLEASLRGGSLLEPLSRTWAWLLLVSLGLTFAGAMLLRRAGPVTGRPGGGLPSGIRPPVFSVGAILTVSLCLLAAISDPVLAAAARAADGTLASLAYLWGHWAAYLMGAGGLLLIVAGVVEHLAMRRSLWRDLHMTLEQARDEARQLGSSRG